VLGRWLGHDYIILLFRILESAIQLSLLIRNNAQILIVECDIYDGMKITYEPSEEDYGWYCYRNSIVAGYGSISYDPSGPTHLSTTKGGIHDAKKYLFQYLQVWKQQTIT